MMKKILAVEDDVTQRYVLKIVLESFALDFEIAASAEEALKLIFEHKHRFALVLMDIKLPGMNGLDCTREIRRREAAESLIKIGIIAVTAYAGSEDRALCFEAGMDDYLSKPYTLEAFKSLIDKYLQTVCCE
ncbi:MAG: response regulator [Candidatus Obscuribacterales bacterium]|nr:response regulator [Cyanobacteria bacterium SZAS LIN-5]